MPNGKFTTPRDPNSEELEIEAAFRQAMGEAPAPTQEVGSELLQEEPGLDDLLLEELLREELPNSQYGQSAALTQDDLRVMIDEIPPEPEETTNPVIKKNRKIVLVSLLSVLLVLIIGAVVTVGYFFGDTITDNGLILDNVTIAGVDVGGMTREEAIKALHKATDLTYTNQDMVILLPDSTLTLTPTQTGAVLDVEAAVDAAYEYGRTGSSAEREAAKAQAASGEYHIAVLPYLSLNTTYIRQELESYGSSFNSTYSEASYTLEGEMPALDHEGFDAEAPCQTLVLNVGTPGRNLDINSLYNQVLDAYSFNTFQVDARDAAPEDIPVALDLEAIWTELNQEAVAASIDTETCEILPETYGYTFDLELAAQLLAEAAPGEDIAISLEYVIPEETAANLETLLFRDVLAYTETKHTSNSNRNTNLRLACASINDLILMPGEVFDYNTALGKRTAEAGYKAAPAYSSGVTVQELGGGICQVSSTLYYATLLADLEIVVRSAHSYVSSYIPYGMDATVSWGGPDFKFANNTNYPVKIQAEVSDGYVKIWIIGTDEKDYFVEMEYEITGSKSYETVYQEFSPDNADGYKDGDIVQTAYIGYTVNTYKCRYDKQTGELLSREFEATSKYKPRDLIIAVVPSGATEDTTPTTPSETPTETPTEAPTEAPSTSESGGETP